MRYKDEELLPTGRLKIEYYVLDNALATDNATFVRLRREQADSMTWYYDFLAAKDLAIRKTVRALQCARHLVRAMEPDSDGKARAAFRALDASWQAR